MMIVLLKISLLSLLCTTNAFIAPPAITKNPLSFSVDRTTNLQSRLNPLDRNNESAQPIHPNSDNDLNDGTEDAAIDPQRRRMFGDILRVTAASAAACAGTCCLPPSANALAQIVSPNTDAKALYDVSRNPLTDAAFAQGMATGMVDYEREAFPKKKTIFKQLFASLDAMGLKEDPVVVEIGMGSFPNALYYNPVLRAQKGGLDIIGIDPNDRMEGYAKDSASRAGLFPQDSLRVVHGVSEALPFADSSVDAVVCTLTLCSVVNPAKSLEEFKRVLKPGGKFLFWEHVLSETDGGFAQKQIEATPGQVKRADGCHLDRRTGETIKAVGFAGLDMEYLELKGFYYLNPTVCGIATA